MCVENHFWLNWWVNLGIAITTFGAVLIALFGERLKAYLFPAKLVISLRNDVGEINPTQLPIGEEKGELVYGLVPVRYYHLRVSNKRRLSKANQVRVYLIRVEVPGTDGLPQRHWTGEVPVDWMNRRYYPEFRTLGPDAFCDLCSVVKDGEMKLHLFDCPNNLNAVWKNSTTVWISFQVKAIETESQITTYKITWDGMWTDDPNVMKTHLRIEQVKVKEFSKLNGR